VQQMRSKSAAKRSEDAAKALPKSGAKNEKFLPSGVGAPPRTPPLSPSTWRAKDAPRYSKGAAKAPQNKPQTRSKRRRKGAGRWLK
jgi:hypothetical protein